MTTQTKIKTTEAPRQLEDWGPSPEQLYSREELRRILETTIGDLAPAHRVVFQLRDMEGFSAEETARALDLSDSNGEDASAAGASSAA